MSEYMGISQFIAKCRQSIPAITYAVFDKEANEYVDGTDTSEYEVARQWAYNLNKEEFQKRTTK
jgi:hypothetical protein